MIFIASLLFRTKSHVRRKETFSNAMLAMMVITSSPLGLALQCKLHRLGLVFHTMKPLSLQLSRALVFGVKLLLIYEKRVRWLYIYQSTFCSQLTHRVLFGFVANSIQNIQTWGYSARILSTFLLSLGKEKVWISRESGRNETYKL